MADSSSSVTTQPAVLRATQLSAPAQAWLLDARKLSPETLARLPVASGTVYFPDLDARREAIFFRYPKGWKARTFPDKHFTQQKGTPPQFWNLEAVLDGPLDDVFICEGELDAVALVESGLDPSRVLSVPSASGDELGYVFEALAAGLKLAKRFTLCGDADKVGAENRHKLARLLGVARCFFVDWPEGCKDANDYLRSDGKELLLERVTLGRLPWPTEGLYKLSEIPDAKPLTVWLTGFDGWRDRIRLAAGTLSVVTGHPGHGKTLLFTQLWFQIVQQYGLVACIASFETRAKPHLRRQLRTLFKRQLESTLTPAELAEADAWIESHYLWLIHPQRRPSLGWFLDQAETAVIRHGARILQIDPWNRLEASREPRESETDYIGRCLRTLYNFAVDMDCHVQVVAHPAKSDGYQFGRVPELESISGCYSDDTEVLTRRGWLRHDAIATEDQVASFDLETELLSWQRPTKVWRYDYRGPMHRHRHRGGDLLVTPNHRMVAQPGWQEHQPWRFFDSSKLFGRKWRIPQSACWDQTAKAVGSDVPAVLDGGYSPADFWSYVGWWIAEGWVACGGLAICQADRNAARLKDIICGLGVSFSDSVDIPGPRAKGSEPMWRARIRAQSHPQLTGWVIRECGVGCHRKRIPSAVWDLPLAEKILVFDALMCGDGHLHKAGWAYSTTSPRLADDVQRLAIELGFTAQKRTLAPPLLAHHKPRFQVNISDRTFSALHPYRNSSVEEYDGVVWCLTVPTGAYVTRRNGWASICGNSKHWDSMVDQGFVVHRPKLFDEAGARQTYVELHHKKARHEELGYATKVALDYDVGMGRYGACGLKQKTKRKPKDAELFGGEE